MRAAGLAGGIRLSRAPTTAFDHQQPVITHFQLAVFRIAQ